MDVINLSSKLQMQSIRRRGVKYLTVIIISVNSYGVFLISHPRSALRHHRRLQIDAPRPAGSRSAAAANRAHLPPQGVHLRIGGSFRAGAGAALRLGIKSSVAHAGGGEGEGAYVARAVLDLAQGACPLRVPAGDPAGRDCCAAEGGEAV